MLGVKFRTYAERLSVKSNLKGLTTYDCKGFTYLHPSFKPLIQSINASILKWFILLRLTDKSNFYGKVACEIEQSMLKRLTNNKITTFTAKIAKVNYRSISKSSG